MARLIIFLAAFVQAPILCDALVLVWPTPNPAFAQGQGIESFIQPTASGEPLSGAFGAVRNNGTRFHEGMDLMPVMKRTRKGEPTDPVYAAMGGVVAHVSTVPGRSSYGRYVVLVHDVDRVQIYTLYAHLASVADGITQGARVDAGTVLGVMGRSAAGYTIPKDRAHVHFEVGLRMGDDFEGWYARQKFDTPNYHGNYNGMNLTGFDPLAFFEDYRAGKVSDVGAYILSLPSAYVLRVTTSQVPSFVRLNPGLLSAPVPEEGLAGWDITFTWFGLPKKWTPLLQADLAPADH
ncbi:MAG: M23 family metallopeptidase, partial [Opitutales bacterium]